MGLAPTGVWRALPPSPIVIGGPFPQAKPLPSPSSPSLFPPPPLALFARLREGAAKGKNPEGKNFRKLLRRKQSSAKISKISRNTIKSSKSDIFYLLRNLLKYLLRTFFSSAKFSEVFTLCVFTLWLFPIITKIIPPEDFLCNVAATGGSLFTRK